ncbi:MAG: transporter substrate-binding domain-containing protein, partial [Nitrospirota bacterium]
MTELIIGRTSNHPRLSAARIAALIVVLSALFACLTCGTGYASTDAPEVRVGSELEFPPYAFVDKDGNAAGFSVDLINAVADSMGLSITISTGPWNIIWNDLVSGRLDVLPVVAKMSDRAQLVDFSLPHTETYDAFFVRKGTRPIHDIKAAKGKEIVVMQSDAAHHELIERNFQGRLVLVDTIPEGLSLISSGKYDAFLCSKLIGTLTIAKHGITGLTAGPPIPDYKRIFSFAVKKGDAELLEKLNQGLMIIKTNGVYERLYEKWLTVDDPWQKVGKYLLPAGGVLLAAAIITGILLLVLQQMVRKRTRELAKANEQLKSEVAERIRVEEEIRKLSLELERRVVERTVQLEEANNRLRKEIEERKQAEEAITRLASFPRLNPNPVMETDSSGLITYFNPAIQRILDDFGLNSNGAKVFLPEDFDDILRRSVKSQGAPFHREAIIGDKVFSTTLHFAPEFEVIRLYAYDITERKHAEEALRRSKEDWEKTFNTVPDMIAILDPEHRIVRANRAMAERLGTSADKCVGLKCFSCVHGSASPPDICPHSLTMADGREHSAELHEDRLGGDFLVSTTPILDENGVMTGSVH